MTVAASCVHTELSHLTKNNYITGDKENFLCIANLQRCLCYLFILFENGRKIEAQNSPEKD